MFVYSCREMKANRWMSRPLKNLEYAAMLVLWIKCWLYLPKPSRERAPTACQYCVYQRVLNKRTGPHRDNFVREDLKTLAEEIDGKLSDGGTWCGVQNSQVRGSAVIVYSMGNCPMKMVFSKMSASGNAGQPKQMYEVGPSFCFKLERGWVWILDCIDDLLMLHSMVFSNIKEDIGDNQDECMLVAMVIRLLSTVGEFYTDTSTMRLTGESLKCGGKDDIVPEVCRDVFT
jgi:hypothetical protein